MRTKSNTNDLKMSLRKRVELQQLDKKIAEDKARREALIHYGAMDMDALKKQYVREGKAFLKQFHKMPEFQRALWREIYGVIPKSTRGRKPLSHAA